ncbi:hypothetical protein BJY04DRAFT_203968 [Aspergillus karnatakaensis]|uniref:uncharacterized protein n=1 Tax=Aspergillus karnatakaensis TaxID=1810916 RepID=UPI003CCCF8A5
MAAAAAATAAGHSTAENAVAGQIRDIIAALNDIRTQLADQNKYLDVLTEKYIHKPAPSRQVYFLSEDEWEGDYEEDDDEEPESDGPLTPESWQYSRQQDITRIRRFSDGSAATSTGYRSEESFQLSRGFGLGDGGDAAFTPSKRGSGPVLLDPFREEVGSKNKYFDCLARPIAYGEELEEGAAHGSSAALSTVLQGMRLAGESAHERPSIQEVKTLRHSLSNTTLVRPLLRRNSLAELGTQRNRYILVFIVATGFSLPIGAVANSFGIRSCVPNTGLSASHWPFMARFLVLFVVTYFTTATCALWFVKDGDFSQDMLGFWKPRRMTTGSTVDHKALASQAEGEGGDSEECS